MVDNLLKAAVVLCIVVGLTLFMVMVWGDYDDELAENLGWTVGMCLLLGGVASMGVMYRHEEKRSRQIEHTCPRCLSVYPFS